jgi:hypothetical protein
MKIKKIINGLYVIMVFLYFTKSSAQHQYQYHSTLVDISINTLDFTNHKLKLSHFIESHQFQINSQDVSKAYADFNLILNDAQYKLLEDSLNTFGVLIMKKITIVNNFSRIQEIQMEIKYLTEKKNSYIELVSKLDTKSDSYYGFWKELKLIEESIHQKDKELLNFNSQDNMFTVNIHFTEESTMPTDTKLKFVNMPGIMLSNLMLESPKLGISYPNYQGYFLKYLFTKGKSFLLAGAYKAQHQSSKDSSQFSELFILGFGQDYYSRHLGRGNRKFFNLYSGYTIGTVMISSESKKLNAAYISPSVGLELFKNKYILLDTYVSYFIPFSQNRNLRGISYNASFNFVF